METNELIEHLRKMGKFDDREPNYYLMAADRLEELRGSLDVWLVAHEMLITRTEYRRYLDYWRDKNGKDCLWYPDGGQVYKDFFAVLAELEETKKLLVRYMRLNTKLENELTSKMEEQDGDS
jgi:hypothetical protein